VVHRNHGVTSFTRSWKLNVPNPAQGRTETAVLVVQYTDGLCAHGAGRSGLKSLVSLYTADAAYNNKITGKAGANTPKNKRVHAKQSKNWRVDLLNLYAQRDHCPAKKTAYPQINTLAKN